MAMKTNSILLSAALLFGVPFAANSQQPAQEIYVAPNAPKDKTIIAEAQEAEQLEAALRPYIEKARSTYPQAKARFLNGLPPKHTFFITTRLRDPDKRIEQVFIAVREIKEGRISGLIATQIRLVSGYQEGDPYSFPESELLDWTISKPDGTEEGNVVGNFLDTYQPTVTGSPVWKSQAITPAYMNERIEKAAIRYAANAPIARIIFNDISYPVSEEEYAALDGNAVILLSAISRVRKELPFRRVYVLSEGKEVELKLLNVMVSELPKSESAPAKTFGRYRADALYLLPMSLHAKNAVLLADFQKNSTGFRVVSLDVTLPDELKRLMLIKPAGTGPSQSDLEKYIKHMYPGFFH